MIYYNALDYTGLIAMGLFAGAYGTLIGAGGGFVLMPLLLLLFPKEAQDTLTAISLAVIFFNALSGTAAYAVMGRVDYKSGLMFSAATIPGAVLGALHTSSVSRRMFDIIFGICLLALSTALILKPDIERGEKVKTEVRKHYRYWVSRSIMDANGQQHSYSFNPVLGVALSLLVGYASSFLGIGGGIIHVPALTFLLNFPVHVATATSHFILAIMAFTGTMVHIMTGAFAHGVHRTVSLSIGVVIGAQFGAHLSKKIKGHWIIRSLAIALGLLGIRILLSSFHLI